MNGIVSPKFKRGLANMVFLVVQCTLGARSAGAVLLCLYVLRPAVHNVGQICAAMAMMKSVHAAGCLPVLLLTGVVCGLVTGALAAGTLQKLPRAVWEKGGVPCWNRS